MRDNQLMEHNVDLKELAGLTKNYSGAEIAGLYQVNMQHNMGLIQN
jgi:SpoVK/Ycf46/Vps4 family AAA+-type ATPase